MNKFIFGLTMSLALFSQANAACNKIACDGKVTELYLRDVTSVYIKTDQDISPLNCTPLGDTYITLEGEHKNADRIYAALLAAKTIKTAVRLRIVENSSNCAIDYVRIFE